MGTITTAGGTVEGGRREKIGKVMDREEGGRGEAEGGREKGEDRESDGEGGREGGREEGGGREGRER